MACLSSSVRRGRKPPIMATSTTALGAIKVARRFQSELIRRCKPIIPLEALGTMVFVILPPCEQQATTRLTFAKRATFLQFATNLMSVLRSSENH